MPRLVPLEKIRNIGIMAHIDAGKTTTTERILFYTGITHKMGEVHEGTAVMDWMEQEQERGITITSAATTCFWKDVGSILLIRRDTWILRWKLRGRSGFLTGRLLFWAPWRALSRRLRPSGGRRTSIVSPAWSLSIRWTALALTTNPVLRNCAPRSNANPIPIQWPIGSEDNFQGVVDLVQQKAFIWKEETLGAKFDVEEIPESLAEVVRQRREQLIESLGEADDHILEKYVHGEDVSIEELQAAIRRATIGQKVVPVLCGSAFKNKGVQPLLEAVVTYLPSPVDIPPIEGV